MSLIQKLEDAATERTLGKSTVQCYSFWTRKFYGFCQKRGSEWTGEDVRSWMLHLADQNYSPVSRKQALNAVVFVFKYVLKRDLGQLDLPPMPKVRHEDLNTTAIYLHADAARGVSPLDVIARPVAKPVLIGGFE